MRFIPLMTLMIAMVAPDAAGVPGFVDSLAAAGKLRVPVEQARLLQARLGQLLVINVDGFGATGPLALGDGFADLVQTLQVGGVIPHYGSNDYDRIVRTNRALVALTTDPLLICCDIVKLRGPGGRIGSFGDGYVGGFLGTYRDLPDDQLSIFARLDAFVFAALGVNVALGPTVDSSTADPRVVARARLVISELASYGLAPVLKHFPTQPPGANLHVESPDARLPADEVARRAAPFHDLGDAADIMMTTHFRDSQVDPNIVTFSPAWNALLRSQTGFKGLLMSDGLLMLTHYKDRSMLGAGLPAKDIAGIDVTAVWAARALLAGHDMVIVEGSAAQTTRAFSGLLTLACSGTPTGTAVAARVEESWARITAWKHARAALLRREVDVPASVIRSVVGLLPGPSARLASFRFDTAGLARLEPALSAAEAPGR